jgi:hypothetical protein
MRIWSCGISGGQRGIGWGFLRVLQLPLSVLIPPAVPHSSSSSSEAGTIVLTVADVPSGLPHLTPREKTRERGGIGPRILNFGTRRGVFSFTFQPLLPHGEELLVPVGSSGNGFVPELSPCFNDNFSASQMWTITFLLYTESLYVIQEGGLFTNWTAVKRNSPVSVRFGLSRGRRSVDKFVLVSGTALWPMTRFYLYPFFRNSCFVFLVRLPLWREDRSVAVESVTGQGQP